MKRIIYILTAIISAAAAVLLIIDYIAYINESGKFSFILYRDPLIAVLLGLCVLSIVQLKKHTPKIVLVFCGYIFIASSLMFGYGYIGYDYFGTLLLIAAALTPAVYELSCHGMLVRQEPKRSGQGRWPWLLTATIALAACRLLPLMFQSAVSRSDTLEDYLGSYTTDVMGIATLVCFAVFCGLMNRRTSGLYRMFFTGCILFDAFQTVFPLYGYFSNLPSPEPVRTMFVFIEALYALFILLILIHAFLTRRDGMLPQGCTDITPQSETPAA